MARARHIWRIALVGALAAGAALPLRAAPAAAVTLPSGFQEQIVFSGLTQPTNIEFAPDGRIFVAEKRGVIKIFDDLADTTPTTFVDMQSLVHNQWDRGLLGMALPPNFPTSPYVYVLYGYGVPLSGGATMDDNCTGASGGANGGNCVISARLSRLQISGNTMTGTEQVLINDWCQQYPSHSIGDLHFGQDGMLYVSAGDGASFSGTDYGQLGSPANPCGDPSSEGGATRAQDVRTTGDASGLDGAILRLDPATGLAATGNPNIGSADLNTRRIVAHGLRNPFRFTVRPGTNELWIGDVGYNTWEEIDRVVNPTSPTVSNFGWPCYEGASAQPAYDSANLPICENLYTAGASAWNPPYFTYNHADDIVPGEGCTAGGDSVSGLAFYPGSGGPYPSQYAGALFFADYSRNCIWAMKPITAGGLPSTGNMEIFAKAAAAPVDLAIGPGGELYYVDLGGTVRRIRYFPGDQPPVPVINATPTSGTAPLAVAFNGTGSTDADPADQGRLTYAWDFTNDGTTDATTATANYTYSAAGNYTAKLTVTDTLGVSASTTVAIQAGNDAPTALIDTPLTGATWAVGDTINFTGHATDPQQGTLAASALTWHLRLQHCESVGNCHTHYLQDWAGVASGSFIAPDHEYPSYLELDLDAVDASGLHSVVTRRLDPKTVDLTFATNPAGLNLAVGATSGVTPFTRTVIQGSSVSVSAPTPQTQVVTTYTYSSWSDGGAQTHVITAPATNTSYTATYTGATPPCSDSFGYVCTEGTTALVAASTSTGITGDDSFNTITLPFSMPFYGTTYNKIWVDTNGVITFAAPNGSSWNHGSIPSAAAVNKPNLALYPFWEDMVVDSSAGIYTQVLGTAPNRQVAVEWRNVKFFPLQSSRVTFEVLLGENGVITYTYKDIDSTIPIETGTTSTVGIENAAGTVAIQYSYNQARLASGKSVTFTPPGATPPPPPPAPGAVSGTVTKAADGTAVSGATVQLVGAGLTTTTNATGGYSFASVPAGSYTVSAAAAGGRCSGLAASAPVTVTSSTTSTVNLALTAAAGGAGYTCAESAFTFDPGTTSFALAGDDSFNTINLPFSVPFYGTAYNKIWVDTNGVITFAAPNGSSWDHSAIPSATVTQGKPNLAIYPYWNDLVIDGSSGVYTKTIGTAPNRQFVIEWRNAKLYELQTSRVTFEVLLGENGTIKFAYTDIDPTIPMEQGSLTTVGVENGAGTAALQYSFNEAILSSGRAITFTPGS